MLSELGNCVMVHESKRMFCLESYDDEFHTGLCADGKQVIMGLLCPYVMAYFFDQDGHFSGASRQMWKESAPQFGDGGPYKLSDDKFQQAIAEQIDDWKEQLGFRSSVIRIEQFADHEMGAGITDRPEYLRGADQNDEDLLEWNKSGNFIFLWGNEYWVSPSGEVEST